MAAEEFFRRWSKPKPDAPAQAANVQAAPETPDTVQETRLPTAADVAALDRDSDFRPFLAQGVDETVKRSALKKLFSDPRFNLMDGLDTYIADYNKFEPLPAEMLAALNHAKSLLNPLGPDAGDEAGKPQTPESPEAEPSARSSDSAPLDPSPASRVTDAE